MYRRYFPLQTLCPNSREYLSKIRSKIIAEAYVNAKILPSCRKHFAGAKIIYSASLLLHDLAKGMFLCGMYSKNDMGYGNTSRPEQSLQVRKATKVSLDAYGSKLSQDPEFTQLLDS